MNQPDHSEAPGESSAIGLDDPPSNGAPPLMSYLRILLVAWCYLAIQCHLLVTLLGINQGGSGGIILLTILIGFGVLLMLMFDFAWRRFNPIPSD